MTERTCRSCLHFVDDPTRIEAEFPYLTVFGSAFSSARGDAGICERFDRFLDPMPAAFCPGFESAFDAADECRGKTPPTMRIESGERSW